MNDDLQILERVDLSVDQFLMSKLKEAMEPSTRNAFDALVDSIEQHMHDRTVFGLGLPEMSMSWTHADGVSIKEGSIGPFSVATGARHKHETINIVAEGELLVFTETGADWFKAGDVFISAPGVRKLVFTKNGFRFLNAVPNPRNIRDEDELFRILYDEPNQYATGGEFDCFLRYTGLKLDEIGRYMSATGDPIMIPDVLVMESGVDGLGVMASRDFRAGESIPALLGGKRTCIARYANHSFTPNTELVGDMAVAIKDIRQGEEIKMNYIDNLSKTQARLN